MTVPAHAGHWLLQLLYAAPVIVLALAIAWSRIQDRRQRRRGPD